MFIIHSELKGNSTQLFTTVDEARLVLSKVWSRDTHGTCAIVPEPVASIAKRLQWTCDCGACYECNYGQSEAEYIREQIDC